MKRLKRKTYRTQRLIIRPYVPGDFSAWQAWGEDVRPPQSAFDWTAPPKAKWNRAEFSRLLKKQSDLAKADKAYVWVAFGRKTGQIIGFADVTIISRGPLQFANLGYRIDNRYWRNGYGKELLGKLIPATLKELRLQRLEAVIDPGNTASVRLARSVGLFREGIRKKYYYQQRGWADQVVFVGLRDAFGLPTLHPE